MKGYYLVLVLTAIVLFLILTKKQENLVLDMPGCIYGDSCGDTVKTTNIVNNQVIPVDNIIYMNNNPQKYNDGIVYNSMYYTDNTFENTVCGGVEYTPM